VKSPFTLFDQEESLASQARLECRFVLGLRPKK